MTTKHETTPTDIVRIWFGRRGAWLMQDCEGFTTRVEHAGLFRREKADRLTADMGRETRIELDLVVASRPPRALHVVQAPIEVERPGLREVLERHLRALSVTACLPTGQAAMIEAETADQLIEDLQTMRWPAFTIRPGHLGEGAMA